jgi:hypothetical protein
MLRNKSTSTLQKNTDNTMRKDSKIFRPNIKKKEGDPWELREASSTEKLPQTATKVKALVLNFTLLSNLIAPKS